MILPVSFTGNSQYFTDETMVSLHCTQNNTLGEWSETCEANSQWIRTTSKHCIDETTGYQYAIPLRFCTISFGWRASERISQSYIVPQLILIIVLLNISCTVAAQYDYQGYIFVRYRAASIQLGMQYHATTLRTDCNHIVKGGRSACACAIDLFHKCRLLHGNEARMLFFQSILVSNYQTNMISFFFLSIRVSF